MKRSILFASATLALLLALGFQTTPGKGAAPVIFAAQNLTVDPYGRVVDLLFDQDLALGAPWDRFRFDMDMVQPLTRDGGAFLGDLTGV